eukprot:439433-Pelagomonas_calceolata.AAC.5
MRLPGAFSCSSSSTAYTCGPRTIRCQHAKTQTPAHDKDRKRTPCAMCKDTCRDTCPGWLAETWPPQLQSLFVPYRRIPRRTTHLVLLIGLACPGWSAETWPPNLNAPIIPCKPLPPQKYHAPLPRRPHRPRQACPGWLAEMWPPNDPWASAT